MKAYNLKLDEEYHDIFNNMKIYLCNKCLPEIYIKEYNKTHKVKIKGVREYCSHKVNNTECSQCGLVYKIKTKIKIRCSIHALYGTRGFFMQLSEKLYNHVRCFKNINKDKVIGLTIHPPFFDQFHYFIENMSDANKKKLKRMRHDEDISLVIPMDNLNVFYPFDITKNYN